jgi:hypothetical protein
MESDPGVWTDPAILSLSDDEPGYVTVVRSGAPSQDLQRIAGANPADAYAVVIRTSGAENPEDLIQVARTVGDELLGP